jgi:hypothetical protein
MLTIDGHITLDAERSIKSIHLSGVHIFDENNEILGSTGGPITVCAVSSELSSGLHLAELIFTSTSDMKYTYSWVFEIK